MTRCAAPARHGGPWARLTLVSAVLLGLLAMHAGLAAHAHAHTSAPCADDAPGHRCHPYDPGAEDHVHQGTLCSALFRDDPEPVPHDGELYGPSVTATSLDASAFDTTQGDPPETPPPRHATDLSVYCVWRL